MKRARKRKTYFLDKEKDFAAVTSMLIQKDVVLIGRGQSKDWYTFNVDRVNCLWLSENHLPRIQRIYAGNLSGHFYCINGLHPDIRALVIKEMGGALDCFTFGNTAEPVHHRNGSGPAFLYYLCEIFRKSDKKIYLVGQDCNQWEEGPVYMPGDPKPRGKSFNGEVDGYRHVWREFSEMSERIFDLTSNERLMWPKMTKEQMLQDINIISFPGIREVVRQEKNGR